EVVGILSFNVAQADVALLPKFLQGHYQLVIFPDLQPGGDYASCSIDELVAQMRYQMSLGDAVQAVQIARFASHAQCLLSWNAQHFVGKMVIPVLSPEDWLKQQAPLQP